MKIRQPDTDMTRYFQGTPVHILINMTTYLLKPEQVFLIDFMIRWEILQRDERSDGSNI